MSIKIVMPALSPTMTEGTLGRWLKKEGDSVGPGEVLAEIETDKATMELEAIDNGILAKIIVADNTAGVKVNSAIALLAEEGEDVQQVIDSYLNEAVQRPVQEINSLQAKTNEIPTSFAAANDEKRIIASPLARKIAAQNNLDLLEIVGTGPYGRIIKDDIMNILNKQQPVQPADEIAQCNSSDIQISSMRKVIAQRLLQSKTTIPHFYLTLDCNVSKLMQLRNEINNTYSAAKSNIKISVNDMIVKATAIALADMPIVNTYWAGEKIIQNHSVDIAIAVALDDGLITPIVKNSDHKSLSVISEDTKSLVKRAKEGKLKSDEFQGGSITISNLGMYNINSFLAIINPPQSCIISVGCVSKKPIVVEDNICIGDIMSIGLSCDHRVIDGALAAQFTNRVKFYLENPLLLV